MPTQKPPPTKNTDQQSLSEALKKVAAASEKSLRKIGDGGCLVTQYLIKRAEEVTSEQNRIKEKIRDGSRLTKHRFIV